MKGERGLNIAVAIAMVVSPVVPLSFPGSEEGNTALSFTQAALSGDRAKISASIPPSQLKDLNMYMDFLSAQNKGCERGVLKENLIKPNKDGVSTTVYVSIKCDNVPVQKLAKVVVDKKKVTGFGFVSPEEPKLP